MDELGFQKVRMGCSSALTKSDPVASRGGQKQKVVAPTQYHAQPWAGCLADCLVHWQRYATERPRVWRLDMRFHASRATQAQLQARRPEAREHSPRMHEAPSGRAQKQRRTTRQRKRPRSVMTGSHAPCTAATGSRSGALRPAFHPRGPDRCTAVSAGHHRWTAPPVQGRAVVCSRLAGEHGGSAARRGSGDDLARW